MRTGDFRHRVKVQKFSTVRDVTGEELEVWADVATRWAYVEALHGKEAYDSNIESVAESYKIRMRYEPSLLTAERRIVFKGKNLDIETVINVDEANKYYEVICRV